MTKVQLAQLQVALDAIDRRYQELMAAGIPWDEALRHVVNNPPPLTSPVENRT
jgi:uncharacterized protein YoaH (UPF0181 family)